MLFLVWFEIANYPTLVKTPLMIEMCRNHLTELDDVGALHGCFHVDVVTNECAHLKKTNVGYFIKNRKIVFLLNYWMRCLGKFFVDCNSRTVLEFSTSDKNDESLAIELMEIFYTNCSQQLSKHFFRLHNLTLGILLIRGLVRPALFFVEKCLKNYKKNQSFREIDFACCPIVTDLMFLGLARRIWWSESLSCLQTARHSKI